MKGETHTHKHFARIVCFPIKCIQFLSTKPNRIQAPTININGPANIVRKSTFIFYFRNELCPDQNENPCDSHTSNCWSNNATITHRV